MSQLAPRTQLRDSSTSRRQFEDRPQDREALGADPLALAIAEPRMPVPRWRTNNGWWVSAETAPADLLRSVRKNLVAYRAAVVIRVALVHESAELLGRAQERGRVVRHLGHGDLLHARVPTGCSTRQPASRGENTPSAALVSTVNSGQLYVGGGVHRALTGLASASTARTTTREEQHRHSQCQDHGDSHHTSPLGEC